MLFPTCCGVINLWQNGKWNGQWISWVQPDPNCFSCRGHERNQLKIPSVSALALLVYSQKADIGIAAKHFRRGKDATRQWNTNCSTPEGNAGSLHAPVASLPPSNFQGLCSDAAALPHLLLQCSGSKKTGKDCKHTPVCTPQEVRSEVIWFFTYWHLTAREAEKQKEKKEEKKKKIED